MEKKFSLNEVDKLISKHKHKKNIISVNNNNINITNKKINNNNNILKSEDSKKNNNNKIENINNIVNIHCNNESLFGNIYNIFYNNLNINNKENVFNTNILDDYIQELDINYEEKKSRKNKIISKTINSNNKSKANSKIENKNKKIKQPLYNNNYDINKDFIIKYSNKDIKLKNYNDLLFKEFDYLLYNNYTPVSYDNNNIDIKKYCDLLSIIIKYNEIKKESSEFIIALLMLNILEKNFEINKINIINDIEMKNKILNLLEKNIKNDDYINKNIINNKNIIDILNNENNFNNIINYNIVNDEEPFNFMIQLFENKIFNKNYSYLYIILTTLDTNNINIYLDEIFNHFDICIYLILKYFDDENKIINICDILVHSLYPNMKFCQYIILKLILGNHEIFNGKFYARMFTSFLNFPTIEKLLIADCYNLILYSINTEVKKIFAKSSILIKYKYSLLKNKFKIDENDIKLRNKIYENISQFGDISNNQFFKNYIKNEFCLDNNNNNNENKEINNIKIENSESENNNDINTINNEGFFSSIKFALGFGSHNINNNNNNNKI